MMLSIDSAAGVIKLGSPPRKLPGILESIEIGGSLAIENASVQGSSGTTRTVHGWNDASLSITLSLIDEPGAKKSRFDRLSEIVSIFKSISGTGSPQVFTLTHPAAKSWGIRELLFSELKTSEDRGRKKISVSLQFVEHESTISLSQTRQASEASTSTETEKKTYVVVPEEAARMLARKEKDLGSL